MTSLSAQWLAATRRVLDDIEATQADSIRRAAELMESAAATRAAVRAALAYPIVLASAGTLAIGVLIGVIRGTGLALRQ